MNAAYLFPSLHKFVRKVASTIPIANPDSRKLSSSAMSNSTVVRSVTDSIATFSRPFARGGVVPIGGRSTAVKLRGPDGKGGVWLLASTPLDDDTRKKLEEMGSVK